MVGKSIQLSTPAGTVIGEDVLTALSAALFCTSLRPHDMPQPDSIRREVLHMLGTDITGWCKAQIARAAAEHPLSHASRIAWCRQMILLVFFGAAASPRSGARQSLTP